MDTLSNKSGLSLIEVIIASLLLALTVGCLLFVFSMEKGVIEGSGRKIQAMNFGCEQLETLKNAVSATWEETGQPLAASSGWQALRGELGTTFAGQGIRYDVTDFDPDGDGATDYKQVTVTVDWADPLD